MSLVLYGAGGDDGHSIKSVEKKLKVGADFSGTKWNNAAVCLGIFISVFKKKQKSKKGRKLDIIW